MAGTPPPTTVSTKQARIAELARTMPETAIRSLSRHIDLDWLVEAHRRTSKRGAVGTDGQTAADFAQDLEGNLQNLLSRLKDRTYRAPPGRRVEIPKAGGGTRPLTVPTFEDKVAQHAVKMVLEPLYEQDFYDCSYGFRPGRSAHDALDHVEQAIWGRSDSWVLDVDVKSFFDTIDHQKLRDLLAIRVGDGVITRLVGKWLRAGALKDGVVSRSEQGTPQGGVISPLLANIYLHHVLDTWWHEEVVPRLQDSAELIRYADDFVMVFDSEASARRVQEVLSKRFEKYGLELHPDKTRLVHIQRPRDGGKSGSFEFLGFTHYFGKTRRKKWTLKRKTSSKRLSRSLLNVKMWTQRHRHEDTKWQLQELNRKLAGYYTYYGIIGNQRQLRAFREGVTRHWRRALQRRSQRAQVPWRWFSRLASQLTRPRVRRHNAQLRLANL